jgi:hypothetical protein
MKVKALILLLHFLAYFISGFAAASCTEVKPMKTMCCKKMIALHHTSKKCPKPSGNSTTGCYNCPLLYIATLGSSVNISIQSIPFKKEFNLLQKSKPTNFSSIIWKPPNVLQGSFEL